MTAAFILPKNSKGTKIVIDKAIMELVEAGIVTKYYSEQYSVDLSELIRLYNIAKKYRLITLIYRGC